MCFKYIRLPDAALWFSKAKQYNQFYIALTKCLSIPHCHVPVLSHSQNCSTRASMGQAENEKGFIGLCWHAAGCIWLEPTEVNLTAVFWVTPSVCDRPARSWALVALFMIPHRFAVGSSSGAAQYSTPPKGPTDLLSWLIIFTFSVVTLWYCVIK